MAGYALCGVMNRRLSGVLNGTGLFGQTGNLSWRSKHGIRPRGHYSIHFAIYQIRKLSNQLLLDCT